MSIYIAAGDYDRATRAFNDPDEIDILLDVYEEVTYSDESTIDTIECLIKFELKCTYSDCCQQIRQIFGRDYGVVDVPRRVSQAVILLAW